MIHGYPDRTSVLPGGTLKLHISTDAPKFRVDFYRQGTKLQFLGSSKWEDGEDIAPPAHPDGTPGRTSPSVSWGWPAYDFPVPADWRTGIYVAMFVEGSADGAQMSFPDSSNARGFEKEWFIVRPLVRGKASILYKKSVTTRTAYNDGSKSLDSGEQVFQSSLYANPVYVTGSPAGHKVSLQRRGGAYDLEDQDVPFIGWLERNGYQVEYCGDVDLHEDASLLSDYKLLLVVGHEEYWSANIRNHIEAFIDSGGNVAFLSGNTCWWRIHFVDDNTAFVCDSDHAVGPKYETYPHLPATDQWWTPVPDGVGNPENRLTGVSYRNGGAWARGRAPLGYTVQHSDHWVFAGTGLSDGDVLGEAVKLVGYECDGAAFRYEKGIAVATGEDGTPADFVILGVGELSPVNTDYYVRRTTPVQTEWDCPPREPSISSPRAATMGVYTRNGGTVFTASCVEWPTACGNGEPAVEQITRNVINTLMGIRGFELDHDLPEISYGWTLVGTAVDVIALAFWDGNLYAATSDARLLVRDAFADGAAWKPLNSTPVPMIALAAVDGKLYSSTPIFAKEKTALWVRDADAYEAEWDAIGSNNADGILAMAGGIDKPGGASKLYAATADKRLWSRNSTTAEENWLVIGATKDFVGLGVSWFGNVSMLYAATADNQLLGHNPLNAGSTWHVLGHANNVTAMTGGIISPHSGVLFAATTAGDLWRIDTSGIG